MPGETNDALDAEMKDPGADANSDDSDDAVDDSDVELEGVDVDDEGEEAIETEDDSGSIADATAAAEDGSTDAAALATDDIDEEAAAKLAAEEAALEEEALKEREELRKYEEQKKHGSPAPVDAKARLEYLMQQSDTFAHFLAGSVAATNARKKNGKGRGSKKGRMTEEEEDSQMLASAQSKRRIVRLDHQPKCLAPNCKMHPYQLEGLNWMIKLHDHGINGILADEMGLGKTLQTISLLAYMRESRGIKGPHLIIVPKSVVGNWIREFKMWCPVIKAIRMGGTKSERQHFLTNDYPLDPVTGKRKFDVLVTSYEGLLREKGKLGKIEWKYLIIDEAHRIKNINSSLSIVVRTIKTHSRMLITGTPLQNSIQELYALLEFLLPDVFGDAEHFDQWFSLSDESGQENVIKKLHTILRPFMLRRVKKDVATSLPPKKETKLYIGLTELQRKWYVSCLQKDAHELNKLGGPEKNRLLNVLMQLRKVCNHPYLFEGAEEGPPYVDGPHLWENSGKMQLLHKLLPKLQAKGSRVLIFCQMTRVLDILEDYFRHVGFQYCRIDGNTDGESRDMQMEEFNAEGSPKFAFLLSTRAGGLGINLATADIVILFDSDWNPQVDLQAMDRAHRLGQTKPVQVFRFITEGTVEEKIIERADRKLFLDAAVIQQGRLAEQNSSLEKGELMKMVRFGADQILNSAGGTYTDEDIDALIARGEEKTSAMQAKLETNAKHNLANFSLIADDDEGTDTFSFGGKNYRDVNKGSGGGNFINLPQRQRKRNYDLSAMENSGVISKVKGDTGAKTKKKKGPAVHDFQLFDMDRLNEILNKERSMAARKEDEIRQIAQLRQQAVDAPVFGSGVAAGRSKEELLQQAERRENDIFLLTLSDEETTEKEQIYAEGFPDWSRKDFKAFCAALERFGRYDFANICHEVINETGKQRQEISRYFVAFWTNYQRIAEWPKILERIERGEKKIFRLRQIRDAIQEKVERHLEDTFGPIFGADGGDKDKPLPSVAEMLHYSWPKMKINYGGNRVRGYQEDEDSFLVCMMYRHGFGAAERIRMEIRRCWQFRFDWYFKSRSAQEIQKRCESLVKIIERENEEVRKKEEEGDDDVKEESMDAADVDHSVVKQDEDERDIKPAVEADAPDS